MTPITLSLTISTLLTTSIVLADSNQQLQDQSSYFFGYQTAQQLEETGLKINTQKFVEGLNHGLEGKPNKLSQDEIQAMMSALRAKQAEQQKAVAKENLKRGQTFLAENAQKAGIITTDSGLQYKIIKKGSGESPKLNDLVIAHYEGRLINGTVFDSSYARGKPAEFPVNGVIKGWQEVLQMMSIGSKWQVFIPSHLAYSERGSAPRIGPNEALVFEIELMSFVKK
jgi:FKBP-type peptidyl-prolyl cis-trans isomerase FklB